ncbi:divergent protein kinase domain 2B, partial [Acipenser oxyrinchus oxyrinchus]
RPVVISCLLKKYKHDVSDTNICTSAAQGVTCSTENVLRSTKRFQKWTSSNFLTPDLVQFPWPTTAPHGPQRCLLLCASSKELGQHIWKPLFSLELASELPRANGLYYHLYYTGVRDDMIGMFEDGRLFITDASTIGVIDKQEGKQLALQIASFDYRDVFSCLSLNCKSSPPCQTVRESQSLLLICRDILPKLLQPSQNQNKHLQNEMDRLISLCGNSMLPDSSIINAANALMALLQPLRPCSQHFTYRYPECK